MGGKVHPATPADEALLEDWKAAIQLHAADMPAERILAIASIFVGQLIAVQDQRRYSPAAVMDLVSRNIERGNRNAVADLISDTRLPKPKGGGIV